MSMTTDKSLDPFGDNRPWEDIRGEHERYGTSSRVLHSPETIRTHGGKWVAAHNGAIVVVEDTMEIFLERVAKLPFPQAEIATRWIEPLGLITY